MFPQTFDDAPTKSDWNRFYTYSPRVRNLFYDGRTVRGQQPLSTSLISHEVFGHLNVVAHPHGRLLPNLRSLSWEGADISSTLQILHFLSPKLNKLHLTFTNRELDEGPLGRLFSALDNHTGDDFVEIRITAEGWDEYLTIDCVDNWIKRQRRLQELWLDGVMLEDSVITLSDLSNLRHIHATFPYPSDADMLQLIETLVSGSPRAKVVHLEFVLHTSQKQAPGLSFRTVPFRVLEPLLRLQRMEALTICAPFPMLLVEEDIKTMGAAWGQMVYLYLCSRPSQAAGDLGTPLSILPAFARWMPGLTVLHHFFLEQDVKLRTQFISLRSHVREKELELAVGSSPVRPLATDRLEEIAEFLLQTFPGHKITLSWDTTTPSLLRDVIWSVVKAKVDEGCDVGLVNELDA